MAPGSRHAPAGAPLAVSASAQAGALAAMEASAEVRERVAEITMRRDEMRRALLDQGWVVPASQADLLWLPTGERTAEAAQRLRDRGIAVRVFPGRGLSLSIGPEQSVSPVLGCAWEVLQRFPELRRSEPEAEGD